MGLPSILLGSAVLLSLALAVAREPRVGLTLIGFVAATEWHLPYSFGLFTVAGLRFTVSDLIVGILVLSLLLGKSDHPSKTYVTSLFASGLVLTSILLTSIIAGVTQYGIGVAINEARSWIYIITVVVWCHQLLNTHNSNKYLRYYLFATGLSIAGVWVLNTIQYGLASASAHVGTRTLAGETIDVGRATTSGQTILLAIAMIAAYDLYQTRRRYHYLLMAMAFAIIVVLAQHRSVWVATAIMSALFLIFYLRSNVLSVVVLVFTVALSYLLSTSNLLGFTGAQLTQSATDVRTFDGRVYDWIYSLKELTQSGWQRVLTGWNFGRGYERPREDGLIIAYTPHNWFVALTLRTGMLGLATGLWWLVAAWRRCWNLRPNHFATVVLVGIFVYSFAYNLQWYLAPLLAVPAYLNTRRPISTRTAVVAQTSMKVVNDFRS